LDGENSILTPFLSQKPLSDLSAVQNKKVSCKIPLILSEKKLWNCETTSPHYPEGVQMDYKEDELI